MAAKPTYDVTFHDGRVESLKSAESALFTWGGRISIKGRRVGASLNASARSNKGQVRDQLGYLRKQMRDAQAGRRGWARARPRDWRWQLREGGPHVRRLGRGVLVSSLGGPGDLPSPPSGGPGASCFGPSVPAGLESAQTLQ